MKAQKKNLTATVYTFQDTTIYTITGPETMTVYQKGDGELLEFIFAVDARDADKIDIEALHDNGYFET